MPGEVGTGDGAPGEKHIEVGKDEERRGEARRGEEGRGDTRGEERDGSGEDE